MHRFLNRSGFAGLLPSGRKSAEAQGWRLRDGNLYIGKALLDALCLTARNLAVPKLSVKNQSNNDVHGYVISECDLQTAIIGSDVITAVYIHIGVGFGVARSDR
ncbi:MAG: hypothetical protein J5965_05080 [Aeriscardovia sp.]|nr:hypothetical protein [Aeriscardovia sp.]